MKLSISVIAGVLGIVIAVGTIAVSLNLDEPFWAWKSEFEDLKVFVGDETINHLYDKEYQLERDLDNVQASAVIERAQTGKLSYRTEERIISLKKSIANIKDKIEQTKNHFKPM